MFKKYSKFQKFIEMLCCGMTRLRNIIKLGVFRQFQNSKTILKTKTIGHKRFKKLLKFLKFQLSNFTLTWSQKGKMNSVWPDMTYSKKTTAKNENVGQNYLEKHLN